MNTIRLHELQQDAPHPNHPSVVHHVFDYLDNGRSLNELYLAYGAASPSLGATVSRSPRVVVCLSGENVMLIPHGDHVERITLCPHDAVFIDSQAWNAPTHEREHTFMTLDFSVDHIRYYCRDNSPGSRPGRDKFYLRRYGALERYTVSTLNALEALVLDRGSGCMPLCRGLVESLIGQAEVVLGTVAETTSLTPQMKWDMVRDFIEDHLHEPLMRSDVAHSVGVHPNHLSRLVKQLSGGSYMSYLHEHRLQRAAHYLKDYKSPVYEIGRQCGFPYPANFSNAFRKRFGCSPGRYRATMTR